MTELTKEPTAAEIFEQITAKLASIDGIATSDAFALGALVRQYGAVCVGEAAKRMMKPLMDHLEQAIEERGAEHKKPWLSQ